MLMSVIIPALGEVKYLNRTIDNIYQTVYKPQDVEVIVVDQGGNGGIDPRAKVITPGSNVGERKAMNRAAAQAQGEFLLRIDAHCDFQPVNWDKALAEVTGEKDITVAVLTAVDQDWQRIPGHWYGLCRLVRSTRCPQCGIVTPLRGDVFCEHYLSSTQTMPSERSDRCCLGSGQPIPASGKVGLEAKWQTPNEERKYEIVEPNMALTGCGFMLRKSFYDEIGGADEDLPPMGAIGEEFAIKAWFHGGKVQTRTDVTIGHIFSTGGYDTSGVTVAQQILYDRYRLCYEKVVEQCPGFDTGKLVTTHQLHNEVRQVVVKRQNVLDTPDPDTNKLLRRKISTYKYVWRGDEHPDEANLTDQEIQDRYGPQGVLWQEQVLYYSETGQEIAV